jgi:hypothetical protein
MFPAALILRFRIARSRLDINKLKALGFLAFTIGMAVVAFHWY